MSKKDKVKKTPKQKLKIVGKIFLCIIAIIATACIACAIVTVVGNKSNKNFIATSILPIEYDNQLEPELLNDENYVFTTDEDFKVMQLTDVHIGGGFMSIRKDNMAINAVASMVSEEKPDLVIVTGDIAYPVPFQSGTFNNKNGAVIFANLMEQLGVYWCLSFGNHDTEAYSYFSREDISKIYSNKEKYPHCLFQSGPEDIDGYGNYHIDVKKSSGEITQSFFMFDSGSYTDGDYFGALWKYDCVHKNQVQWYKDEIAKLSKENNNVTPSSLAFMHIPIIEFQEAYYEYRDNGFKDTKDAQYLYGQAGEHKKVLYASTKNYGLFDAFLETGSTKAAFFGHDHLNNFSMMYKGIQLTYGYSVDYLAYIGIAKYGVQRGCTIINCKNDGTFTTKHENYYQDKYQAVKDKESVTMDNYNEDADYEKPIEE